jgi:hypothetical protein
MNSSPASEREALTAFLDKQRDILVRKLEGVTDDDARKTPAASSLSLLGILKHCALWERRWFQPTCWSRRRAGHSITYLTTAYLKRGYGTRVTWRASRRAACCTSSRCA